MTERCVYCLVDRDKARWVLRYPDHPHRWLCDNCTISVAASVGLKIADELRQIEQDMEEARGATVQ